MDNAGKILALREELALLEESDKSYHDDPAMETQACDFRRRRRFELLVEIADLEEQSSAESRDRKGQL